jgi:ketosteroid isomerase-like protein
MSRANVDVVQRWIDAYNCRDIDGVIALSDADIEFRSVLVAIEPVFRGHSGIRSYFQELDESYDHFQLVPTEFIEAGAAVVFENNVKWRGKESGVGGETYLVPAVWLRAGKVFRIENFTDRKQALEAVGLSEEEARAVSFSAARLRN